jgi:hypothetical protein
VSEGAGVMALLATGNPELVPVIFGVCFFVVWPLMVWLCWMR